MVIGNKLDLIDDKNDKRKVTQKEAITFCEKNNIIWGGEKSFKDINKDELEEIMKDLNLRIYDLIGEKKIKVDKVLYSYRFEERRHGPEKCFIY